MRESNKYSTTFLNSGLVEEKCFISYHHRRNIQRSIVVVLFLSQDIHRNMILHFLLQLQQIMVINKSMYRFKNYEIPGNQQF